MAYAQGIAFRATSGYVTDGATDSFEPGGSPTYPRTTAQGNIVGWEQAIGNTRDRSTTVDHRLAGIHYTASSQEDFRFDLPAAGTYNIRIAAGDISSVNNTVWSVVDGTTVLGSLTTGTNGASGSFRDATNTQLTAAAWPGSNTAVAFTFSTTICRIRSSSTAAADVIAYVYVEDAAPSGVTGSLAASEGSDTAAASGSPTVSGSLAKAEAADTGAITASVSVAGTLARTEGSDTLAASGTVAAGPITGTLATTEGADTLVAIGTSAAPANNNGIMLWLRAYDRMHKRRRKDDEPEQVEAPAEVQAPIVPTLARGAERMRRAQEMEAAQQERAAADNFVRQLGARAKAKARAAQEDENEVMLLLM